jgi:CelD/BcsL family acetyltransferase involved in cellulose biosynthesis
MSLARQRPDLSLPEAPALRAIEKVRSLAVSVAGSSEAMLHFEQAWRHLQSHRQPAGVFATWQWHSTAARFLARDARLHVALVERDGEPMAIAPFVYRRKLGMAWLAFLGAGLADYAFADYQDFVYKPGEEQDVLRTFAAHLADQKWDVLHLQELPPGSPTIDLLPSLALDHGWHVVVRPDCDVHRVTLPPAWETYLSGVSASWRKEMQRKQRRLEAEKGATFHRFTREDDIGAAVDALVDLHTARWNAVAKPGIFATPQARAFYTNLAYAMRDDGMLYMSKIERGGETVGAGFGFDYQGTRYAYTYGYNPGPEWERYSLGLMLDCFSLRNGIKEGIATVDLMRGEAEYKKRYGVVSDRNVEVFVFRSRQAYLLWQAYETLRSTAKRALRRWRS